MSNRQVAGELFVSIKTVQFHLTHIYTKFGIKNRAELAAQLSTPTPQIAQRLCAPGRDRSKRQRRPSAASVR